MGLDDRDYMRERYRNRAEATIWNDRMARVEANPCDRGNGGVGARRRSPSPQASAGWPPRWVTFAGGILLGLCATWYWTARGRPPVGPTAAAFPASGSVTVNREVDPRTATSRMKVTAGRLNAVIQLFAPESDAHILSVYVRQGDSVTVAVPPGVFRMRLIEGRAWYGQARYFGPSTRYETVRALQKFTAERGGGIDLRRSPAGTMHTKSEWRSPPPL